MFKNYISTVNPVYIVIILEQSSRMDEPFVEDLTKAEYQCKLVNEFINDLIFSNSAGDKIKDRFYISIISHKNSQANEISSGWLSSFANNLIRTEKTQRKVSNGVGGLVEIEVEVATYVESLAFGKENQLDAFKLSKELAFRWFNERTYCSTLIINISGGFPSNWKETTMVINAIKKVGIVDDSPFIYNLLLDTNVKKVQFPDLERICFETFTSQLYFEWSSYVTNDIIESGLRHDLKILKSSKLFSTQKINDVLNFINFGS
jgi:hypothetical protein